MLDRKPTRGIAVAGTRIWLDVSSHSVVLVCNECAWQGIAFSRDDADEQCTKHWASHKGIEPWGKSFATQQQPCRHDDLCEGKHYARQMCERHYRQFMYEVGLETREPCSEDDCIKPVHGRGLCAMHYSRLRKSGAMTPLTKEQPHGCTAEGCDRKSKAKGLCMRHYARAYAAEKPRKKPSRSKPPKPPKPVVLCRYDDCEKTAKSKGMCPMHYMREKRAAQ